MPRYGNRIIIGLLECALHKTTLEEYSEVKIGTECTGKENTGGLLHGPYNITVIQALLVAGLLLGPVQCIGYHF